MPAPGGDSETELGDGRGELLQITDGQRDRGQSRSGYGPVGRTQDVVLARERWIQGGLPLCGVCYFAVPEGQATKCPWCKCVVHAACFGKFFWNGRMWTICNKRVTVLTEARGQLPRALQGQGAYAGLPTEQEARQIFY